MNERYLFRGKRTDNGEWAEGFCMPGDGDKYSLIWHEYDERNSAWYNAEVDYVTVGQCAGLCDKNRTLIFEGDIISCVSDDDEPETYIVTFENYRWELRSPMCNPQELFDFVNEYTVLEIIGNIYDNPELL